MKDKIAKRILRAYYEICRKENENYSDSMLKARLSFMKGFSKLFGPVSNYIDIVNDEAVVKD